MTQVLATDDIVATAQAIGTGIAGPAADAVDSEGRFPREAIDALRDARMLGAFVPHELGGRGASISDLAAVCETLGRSCASTAMIYAMHQIQVACLVHHGHGSAFFRDYLAGIARHEWLLASGTSEVGTGGELRRSLCAVVYEGASLRVGKRTPVISYGEEADAVLLTARRGPAAAPSDQVLVLLTKGDMCLTRTGEWDALGMRGTRSLGFSLDAVASPEQVLPDPFADIATRTMIPMSHVLWSSLWLGLASDAVARAHAFIRSAARQTPGSAPPGALRLAEAVADLASLRATVQGGLADFERRAHDPGALDDLGFAIGMNSLKSTAARLAPHIVAQALATCGISGYRNGTPYSVGRHLRDAYSAALMVNNDRLLAANAHLLLVHKGD